MSGDYPLFDLEEVLAQINTHVRHLKHSRALLPHMTSHMVGWTVCPTAPYYRALGYDATIVFSGPLTEQKVKELNEAWALGESRLRSPTVGPYLNTTG